MLLVVARERRRVSGSSKLQDHERFFETLAQAGRGVLVAVTLQPGDRRAELLARRIRRGRSVRHAHRREHVGVASLRQMLPKVSLFVTTGSDSQWPGLQARPRSPACLSLVLLAMFPANCMRPASTWRSGGGP
jgi:hypothetical protein